MRAVFYPFLENQTVQNLSLTGETAHHLNVVRVKIGDQLLLLNGKGEKLRSVVTAVGKKALEVNVLEKMVEPARSILRLAIATPKKEAFEDILKMAVELGVTYIQPLSSHFSQYNHTFNDRSARLLESALIQSNNGWLPVIQEQKTLKKFLDELTDPLFFFNSAPMEKSVKIESIAGNFGVLIGPEGGFSPEEIALISQHPRAVQVHLPTPILRAPTAVAASIGFLLALKKA